MIQPESPSGRYIELAVKNFKERAVIIGLEQLPQFVEAVNKKTPPWELYRSYFCYDGGIVEHAANNRTVRGYRGRFSLDRIVFDIDRGAMTLQQTLDRTRAFREALVEDWISEDGILLYFSGRGFHIETPDFFGFEPGWDLPMTVKTTLVTHFPEVDDLWYPTSIIRVAGTINIKSNLYKIPLTHKELYALNGEEIEQLARMPRIVENDPLNDEFALHKSKIVVALPPSPNEGGFRGQRSQDDPTTYATCMQKVYNRGGVEGTRHTLGMMLIASWRRNGITPEGCRTLFRSWAPGFAEAELEKLIKDVFDIGYRWSCHNPDIVPWCDTKCIYYKRKNYMVEAQTSKQLEQNFINFIRTDFSDCSFDMGELYRLPSPYPFRPGELNILTGKTKKGKTAFMQNIVVHLDRLKTLYINTEIAEWLLYRRFIQMKHQMTEEEVVRHYRQHANTLSQALSHINVVTTTPTVQMIRQLIADMEPQIVVIDTTEGVSMDGATDQTMHEKKIILGLRDLARETGVILWAVHHIRKGGGLTLTGGTRELLLEDVKGSSAAIQQADKIIAVEGEDGASRRVIRSLAARDAGEMRLILNFDWPTMTFRQV